MPNGNTQPAASLRSGPIKAVIWRNQGQNGTWYSVKFTRSYTDGETWKETDSFSGDQLLVVAHLSAQAFGAVADLEAADRAASGAAQ